MSIWSSIPGEQIMASEEDSYDPAGEAYRVDVAVSPSWNAAVRLSIWAVSDAVPEDLACCLTVPATRALIQRLEAAVSAVTAAAQ